MLLGLFSIGGLSSLVLEVVWTRCLALVLGSTQTAISVSLSVFMIGLGLGAWMAGRAARSLRDPLRAYALVELTLGVSALIATSVVFPSARLVDVLSMTAHSPALFAAARLFVVVLLLLLPCTAMGATLPLLVEFISRQRGRDGASRGFVRVVSALYAVNTIGAAIGALLTDFVLIPSIGTRATALTACACDLIVGLVVLVVARSPGDSAPSRGTSVALADQVASPLPWGLALFACGFCGMALEVSWTRVMVFFNGSDVYAFSTVVATYLLGLVLGSALVSAAPRWFGRDTTAAGWLLLALVCTAACALVAPDLVNGLRGVVLPSSGLSFNVVRVLSNLAVMLPSTVLLGALFPLLSDRWQAAASSDGEAVGRAYALNVAGSVLGSAITGFLLLPWLGLQGTVLLICALLSLTALLQGGSVLRVVASLQLLAIIGLATLLPRDFLVVRLFGQHCDLRFHAEDAQATVALVRERSNDDRVEVDKLLFDGFSMMTDAYLARRYASMFAIVPLLTHRGPSPNVLVVCLGLGSTLEAAVSSPDTLRVDCVDLSPSVYEVNRLRPQMAPVLSSSKLAMHFDDGRSFLAYTPNRYDIIAAEPPPPIHAGVVNLYTREYFALCRDRLKPDGIVAHWLPIQQLSAFEARTVMRAFHEVFPYAYVWHGAGANLCLVGATTPLDLRLESIEARLSRQPSSRLWGLDDAGVVLAQMLLGPAEVAAYVADTPPLTDDRPYIEYSRGEFAPDVAGLLMRTPDLGAVSGPLARGRGAETDLKLVLYGHAKDPRIDLLVRMQLGRRVLRAYPGNTFYRAMLAVTDPHVDDAVRRKDAWELVRIHFTLGSLNAAGEVLGLLANQPGADGSLIAACQALIADQQGINHEPPLEARELLQRARVR